MATLVLFSLVLWLVLSQVGNCGAQAYRIVVEKTECRVAARAEQSAYRPSRMLVIHREVLRAAGRRLHGACTLADCAYAALGFVHGIVLGRLQTEPLSPARICTKSVVFLSISSTPRCLLVPRARATERLKPIDLFGISEELIDRLKGLACPAPLGPVRSFRASRRCPVVPAQVVQGLALDPSQGLFIPGCNPRWSAAAALAHAFRYFGHHDSLSFPEPQLSKGKA
jgi:hypothetical protein